MVDFYGKSQVNIPYMEHMGLTIPTTNKQFAPGRRLVHPKGRDKIEPTQVFPLLY